MNPKAPHKNLKIHLDNILNNLCDTTLREMFLEAADYMRSAFLASVKQMSCQLKNVQGMTLERILEIHLKNSN